MINLIAILGLGFLLGMRHATDPDHVIAVTTIVSRERNLKQAALVGVAWGAGHTLTIVAVGSLMILFRVVFPPPVGLGMEMAVALMLILLGLRNMGPLFGYATESSAVPGKTLAPPAAYHRHGDYIHAHQVAAHHAHPHDPESTPLRRIDRWFGRSYTYRFLRPLVVGTVHGLAGFAAIALLVLGTIQSVCWAAGYLLVFGLGTILGMMLITMTLETRWRARVLPALQPDGKRQDQVGKRRALIHEGSHADDKGHRRQRLVKLIAVGPLENWVNILQDQQLGRR